MMQNCFITRFSVFHVIKNLYIVATKHKHILRNRKVYFFVFWCLTWRGPNYGPCDRRIASKHVLTRFSSSKTPHVDIQHDYINSKSKIGNFGPRHKAQKWA